MMDLSFSTEVEICTTDEGIVTVTPWIVKKALNLVFGSKSEYADLNMVKMLDERILKSAFREKAMYFHPDRAEVLGLDAGVLDELFKRLSGAYRLLKHVVLDQSVRANPSVRRYPSRPARPTPRRTNPTHGPTFYRGRMPETKMKFGQFLYYYGVIDWQSMIDALTWQRSVRPKIGEMGRTFNFFDHSGVISIIREKQNTEFFGDTAMRMGMVSRFQLNAMIGKQKSLNYPIGLYFLKKGVLSSSELDSLLNKNRQHNFRRG